MRNYFIIICSIFLLMGCTTKYMDESIYEDKFLQKKSAIVIIRMLYPGTLWGFSNRFPVLTYWTKMDNDDRVQKVEYCFNSQTLFSAPALKAYMVEPGYYILDKIEFSDTRVRYFSMVPGWDPHKKVPLYASFEVKAGEVVYLGDVKIEPYRNRFDIKISDEFMSAQAFFKSEYPTITTPVIKRLINPGISLSNDIEEKFVGEESLRY